MTKFLLGVLFGQLVMGVALATPLDAHHPQHEKAEQFVCSQPSHAYKAHGLRILPEACDGKD